MSTYYACHFRLDAGYCIVYSDDGIAEFKDGFWINAQREFTKGSDCMFWIPPSAIVYIQKRHADQSSAVQQEKVDE